MENLEYIEITDLHAASYWHDQWRERDRYIGFCNVYRDNREQSKKGIAITSIMINVSRFNSRYNNSSLYAQSE